MTCCTSAEDPIGCCGENCEHDPVEQAYKPGTVVFHLRDSGAIPYEAFLIPNIFYIDIFDNRHNMIELGRKGEVHIFVDSASCVKAASVHGLEVRREVA